MKSLEKEGILSEKEKIGKMPSGRSGKQRGNWGHWQLLKYEHEVGRSVLKRGLDACMCKDRYYTDIYLARDRFSYVAWKCVYIIIFFPSKVLRALNVASLLWDGLLEARSFLSCRSPPIL